MLYSGSTMVVPRSLLVDECPCEDDIAAFLHGRLAASCVRRLEAHVCGCPDCRRVLSAIAQAEAITDSVSPTLPLDSGTADAELAIGARVGRYIVLDWLAAGSMGVVYSALDPELNRKVALKVLREDGAGRDDRSPMQDLLREAQAMAALAHPNVVRVFDVGSIDERVFLAMELVEGMTLAQWLDARRRGQGEIIAAFRAAGSGLAAAHAAGLIHRDFKPDNVLVGNDGRICVTDFGLARHAVGAPRDIAGRRAHAPGPGAGGTRTGLAGTPAYMAPEQVRGQRVDARADQFSFAVALHEALHGERPFAGSDRMRTAPRGGRVPRRLRKVLRRALRPAPDDRFPSMTELLRALAPEPRPGRGRLIGIAAFVALATTALAAGPALRARDGAGPRGELVGRLRGLAPEMRTLLRSAHMLPLHDIRTARDEVRSTIRDVERELQTQTGRDEIAVGSYVVGEGHLALGDHEPALAAFEAAWRAGERGAHIEAAFGAALGAVYEHRLAQLEATVESARREIRIHAIEVRYRDPALAHLRAALAAGHGSTEYLEALIAFHEHRFTESSRHAQVAFAGAPTFYEAGALEARARSELGRQWLSAGKDREAEAEFAAARQIFQRVLEIARSDDQAWLGYGEMVYAQAIALNRGGAMPQALQQEAIAALHNAERIDPASGVGFLREAQIQLGQGNIELIWYRDPSWYADQALALTREAQARGADAADASTQACVAHWLRAVYQGHHGADPGAAFQRAVAACGSAATTRRDADAHGSLGVIYCSLGAYEGEHGHDPTRSFELAERELRAALVIDDDPGTHYSLGFLWTRAAHYHQDHGGSPERAIDAALAEYEAAARMNATRADAWAGISDVLSVRAQHRPWDQNATQATLARARSANERALAIDGNFVPAIRYRAVLAELDAAARLRRGADPSAAVHQMRGDARLLSSRLAGPGWAHRLGCEAELAAARWAIAHHDAVDPLLARAAAEAARARDDDGMDAQAWTVSAEVEQLRGEAARARGLAPSARVVARGLAFVERAIQIDPELVRARQVRDELGRQAHPARR
jgi:tetratricopeptide (TPR) repeat protein/predicted Ser/Thr protein kinase